MKFVKHQASPSENGFFLFITFNKQFFFIVLNHKQTHKKYVYLNAGKTFAFKCNSDFTFNIILFKKYFLNYDLS